MYDSFTDIELIARHRIAERVRYSPRAPKRRGSSRPGRAAGGQDRIATPRRQ